MTSKSRPSPYSVLNLARLFRSLRRAMLHIELFDVVATLSGIFAASLIVKIRYIQSHKTRFPLRVLAL